MFNLDNKRILVTGGAGAIGRNLLSYLLGLKNAEVIVLDDLSSGNDSGLDTSNIIFYKADIANNNVLSEIFQKEIHVVFHLAANFANQNSIEHPEKDLVTNVLGTVKLLEFSKRAGVKKFVYTNTSCMYPEDRPFIENSPYFDYHTPYAISKHTAEHYVIFYNNYYNLPSVSLRVFNSFGPYEFPGKYRNVIPNFINAALKGESLTVMGDGNDTRSFTYVDDLVNGIVSAVQSDNANGQIFNMGGETETKVIDLATKINSLTGNNAPIKFIEKRDWDKATRRKPDITKAKSVLGYRNEINLEDGLIKTIDWFKNELK